MPQCASLADAKTQGAQEKAALAGILNYQN